MTNIELTESVILRFLSRIEIVGECWEWSGARMGTGYGEINIGGKIHKCNRIAFLIFNGYLHDCLSVIHTCDNKACVRPEHIYQGTHTMNMIDKMMKGKGGVSKLTPHQITCIRKLNSKYFNQVKLAKMFNIGQPHISMVVRRKVWEWLP